MNKCTNLEDNIFILNTRIRMLQDLFILDADPELFLGKTLDDMEFIDATLGSLLAALDDNARLVDRDELFHSLNESAQRFLAALTEAAGGQGTISAAEIPLLKDAIVPHREHTLALIKTLEGSRSGGEPASSEPVVTSDELNELLRDF
jgi:hypothetical protein